MVVPIQGQIEGRLWWAVSVGAVCESLRCGERPREAWEFIKRMHIDTSILMRMGPCACAFGGLIFHYSL